MNKPLFVVLLGIVLSVALIGCGPPKVEKLETVLPSETAFLISLEGDTQSAQDMFKSAEFLEKNKIAAKQISLSQRSMKTGRFWYQYVWIPTQTVIKVSRAPITREWTAGSTGTNPKDQAIHVESKDSIGFGVGVNLTASIEEKDTAQYLYKFAGRPIEETIDSNVRSFVQSILSVEFGGRNLTEGIAAKREIGETLLKSTQEQFKPMGITVDYIGLAEGLQFDNKQVQEALDAKFKAEVGVKTAEQEAIAQEQKNKLTVSKAKAEREAAEEFKKAQDALVAKTQLQIYQDLAKNWNGVLPNWLMITGGEGMQNMLMNIPSAPNGVIGTAGEPRPKVEDPANVPAAPVPVNQ